MRKKTNKELERKVESENFTEEEGVDFVSRAFGIPVETLEARMKSIRGEYLLKYEDVAFIFDDFEEEE